MVLCQVEKRSSWGYLGSFGRLGFFVGAFFTAFFGVAGFAVVFAAGFTGDFAGVAYLVAALRGADFAAFLVPGFVRKPSR